MVCGKCRLVRIRPRELGLDTWRVRIDCEQAGVGQSGVGLPEEAVLSGGWAKVRMGKHGHRVVTIMSTGNGSP
jgi:hypothetical protein